MGINLAFKGLMRLLWAFSGNVSVVQAVNQFRALGTGNCVPLHKKNINYGILCSVDRAAISV
jgi:hypothetical protein